MISGEFNRGNAKRTGQVRLHWDNLVEFTLQDIRDSKIYKTVGSCMIQRHKSSHLLFTEM